METQSLKTDKVVDLLSRAGDLLHLAYVEMQELQDSHEIPLDNINSPLIAEVWSNCNDKLDWIGDIIFRNSFNGTLND